MRRWVAAALSMVACGPLPALTDTTAADAPGATSGRSTARAQELSGGTLALSTDGTLAVVADSEHDRLWVVDLSRRTVRGRIELPQASRPGRMVATGPQALSVALRGTGEVATVDLKALQVLARRRVCAEPFSLAVDPRDGVTVVGCLGGEVSRLPAEASAPSSMIRGPRDLRDVLFSQGELLATTFRASTLVRVEGGGAFAQLPNVELGLFEERPVRFVPRVAWRAVPTTLGRVVIAHQREVSGNIAAIQLAGAPSPAYYSNTCGAAIVRSALSVVASNGTAIASIELPAVLPVDVAVSDDGEEVAVAFAGSDRVARMPLAALPSRTGATCQGAFPPGTDFPTPPGNILASQPTGTAFRPDGTLVVHTRVPFGITLYPRGASAGQTLILDGDPATSPAQALFHQSVGGLACASCHPEGRDDGHAWTLLSAPVRTQSLAGGLSATLPFHWKGELRDMKGLMDDTFVARMGGVRPDDSAIEALQDWVDGIPLPKVDPIEAPEVVGYGQALFAQRCQSCHAGPLMTSRGNLDVGSGGAFQVPVLRGLALRAPFMHDGCAATLRDRFGACGGTRHGDLGKLEEPELAALVAYLDTL